MRNPTVLAGMPNSTYPEGWIDGIDDVIAIGPATPLRDSPPPLSGPRPLCLWSADFAARCVRG